MIKSSGYVCHICKFTPWRMRGSASAWLRMQENIEACIHIHPLTAKANAHHDAPNTMLHHHNGFLTVMASALGYKTRKCSNIRGGGTIYTSHCTKTGADLISIQSMTHKHTQMVQVQCQIKIRTKAEVLFQS